MRTQIMQATRNSIGKRLTPMQKAVEVNTILGNPNIAKQQGTSRVMYDTLPLDARVVFNFFENVQNRAFPRTNLNQNKLQVGETFVVNRIYFCVCTFDAVTLALTTVVTLTVAARPALYGGQFSIFFDTMQVMKPYPLSSQNPSFNKLSRHITNEWIPFETNTTLPTDIQFTIKLETPLYVALANAELRCVVEGFGTLLSPKTQF